MTRTRGHSRDETTHPVHVVHRVGSAVLGAGLVVFGAVGLLDMPDFFGSGRQTMGMGSNGALAVLSAAVGALLIGAAARGGRLSSTVSIGFGVLFLVSGFGHLAILDTEANVLAFRLSNVFFSFAAGLLLLTLGAYGRLTGGLAPDNPYAAAVDATVGPEDEASAAIADVEEAAATGHATPEQQAVLRVERGERADESHEQAWRGFAATHTEAEVAHMRSMSTGESVLPKNPKRPS